MYYSFLANLFTCGPICKIVGPLRSMQPYATPIFDEDLNNAHLTTE